MLGAMTYAMTPVDHFNPWSDFFFIAYKRPISLHVIVWWYDMIQDGIAVDTASPSFVSSFRYELGTENGRCLDTATFNQL